MRLILSILLLPLVCCGQTTLSGNLSISGNAVIGFGSAAPSGTTAPGVQETWAANFATNVDANFFVQNKLGITNNVTIPVGSHQTLYIFVAAFGGTACTNVSLGEPLTGTMLSLVIQTNYSSTSHTNAIWYMDNPPQGASKICVNYSANATEISVAAVVMTNTAGRGTSKAAYWGTGGIAATTTSPQDSMSTLSTDWILVGLADGSQNPTYTDVATQTSVARNTPAGNTTGYRVSTIPGTGGSVTCGWTITSGVEATLNAVVIHGYP